MPFITLPPGTEPDSVDVTNVTYAAIVMRDGDTVSNFTDRFGGPDGNEPDWFQLRVVGATSDDIEVGSIEFYLADYRSPNDAEDFIIDEWTNLDLSLLANLDIAKLAFRFDSSDRNEFGILTPAYVAIDNLRLIDTHPADFDLDLDIDLAGA